MALVSVIMSTYNEKLEYLKEAIESVRNQTYHDFEFLIVLDNPENAEIRQCVLEYVEKDARIQAIFNEKNIGLTRSLNKAIGMAKGRYMLRMDADDIMQPDCLKTELKVMKKENLDFVSASKKNIDEQGRVLGTYVNDFSPQQMRKLLPYDNSVNHPTVLVKLEVVRREGGYRMIPSCEDYDLWLRMLGHGCCMRIIPDVFLLYRMRKAGVCESNAYQLYISKHFVMDMYKKGKKDMTVFEDEHAYERYLTGCDFSVGKAKRFNKAYKLLYKGIADMQAGNYKRSLKKIWYAVGIDKDILIVLLDKAMYQMRKRLIASCGRKRKL